MEQTKIADKRLAEVVQSHFLIIMFDCIMLFCIICDSLTETLNWRASAGLRDAGKQRWS